MNKKSYFIIISSIILVLSVIIIGIVLGMSNNNIYLTFSSPVTNINQTIEIQKGSTINLNNYSENIEGYEFIGWYATNSLSEEVDSNYVFTSSKTIYAGYSKIVNIKDIKNLKFKGLYSYTIVSDGSTKLEDSHIQKLLSLNAKRLDFSNCEFKSNNINKKLFSGSNIETLILSDNISTIESNSFYNCFNLKEIICGNNLKIIETKAFENCYNLKNVSFKYGLLELQENIFYSCNKLEELNLPGSVNNIYPSFISNCNNFKNINMFGVEDNYISIDGILYSKDKKSLIKYPEAKKSSVILPEETEIIEDYAFYKSKVANIEFNNNIKTIGVSAFESCENLENIKFKNSKTYNINKSAFENCINLKSVEFGVGLKNLADSVFKNNKNLETVEILNTTSLEYSKIENIGNDVFWECKKLRTFEIPSSVVSLGNNIFYNCSSLESVVIAGNIKILNNRLFYNCKNLKSVDIHSQIENLNNNVFYNCEKLETITNLNNVKNIGEYNFYNCKNLKLLNLENVENFEENNFYNCESLQEINLNSVKEIRENSFINCCNLNLVKTGSNLEKISDNAIINCNNLVLQLNNNSHFNFNDGQILSLDNTILYWYNNTNKDVIILKETQFIYNYALSGKTVIENFIIEENNYYKVLDNCLINKDNILVAYPSGLKNEIVSLNQNIVYINKNSIQNKYIKELIIGSNVLYIENGSLKDLNKLEKLTIPFVGTAINGDNSQRWIGSIFGCEPEIKETAEFNNGLYLPESLKTINVTNDDCVPKMAFYNAYNLEYINFSTTATIVNEYAFYGCNKLKSINLSGNIKIIKENAISKNVNLSELSLGYYENITVENNSINNLVYRLNINIYCEKGLVISSSMQRTYKNKFYNVYSKSKQWYWNITHVGG